MNIILLGGPADGRKFEIERGSRYLNVPICDPIKLAIEESGPIPTIDMVTYCPRNILMAMIGIWQPKI